MFHRLNLSFLRTSAHIACGLAGLAVLGCDAKGGSSSEQLARATAAGPNAALTGPRASVANAAAVSGAAARSGTEAVADTVTKLQAPASSVELAHQTSPGLHQASGNLPPADGARVYAKTRNVWIRSMPQSDVQWIGYLWWGGSVKTRSERPVPGAGCSKHWVPVEPRGWVCVDDQQATQDPNDPQLLAIYPYRPRLESPWPHNYAWVHAAVSKFHQTPQPQFVGKLDPSVPAPPAFTTLPRGLQESQTKIVGRSALSYVDAFKLGESEFLLTGDLGWVPKDRVELLPRSEFVGVQLGEGIQLPVAFFRGKARSAFSRAADGSFTERQAVFARHAHVALSGETEQVGRIKYYKVKGQDAWVSDHEAVIPTPQSVTPWGAPVGRPDTTGRARSGRATWIELSILEGWLVAFEGTTPRYVTMISAGRGGTPVGDRDPLETASTPTGRFAIGGKFKTATMESSSSPILHADVPWTQNFSGPHAIHSAYWHDDFGQLKSAGCVNVSPRDGKWLFEFTEPAVPEGWHGVRYIGRYGGGSTLVILHE